MSIEATTTNAFDAKAFNKLLESFKSQYGPRQGGLNQYVGKVVELLNGPGGLQKSSNIPHLPITWRMKTLDSAINSLRRRQDARMERQTFKERLEKLDGQKWEDYWKSLKSEHRITDVGPFQDVDSMFGALHDIGGVRICVYFPGDVQKVVDLLQEKSERGEVIEVVRVVQRGQGTAPDMARLKDYVNALDQQDQRRISGVDSSSISDKQMFAGYRATHVIVKLEPGSEPEGYKDFPHKNVVEIQVATIVMHAWSQIEHDIIYKPGLAMPSENERSFLETFNGIVMTGESVLSQLAKHREEREMVRLKNETMLAQDIYEFGGWLLKVCREHSIDPRKSFGETTFYWFKLDTLFDILQANSKHSYGELEKLVVNTTDTTRGVSIGYDFPVYLLKEVCTAELPPSNKVTYENESDAFDGTRYIARSMAERVVQSLNMAVYLGVNESFVRKSREVLATERFKDLVTPSLSDMLDLLHPKQSRLNWITHRKIKQFCEAFLDREKFKRVENDPLQLALLELPTMLTEAGYVSYPVVEGLSADEPGGEFMIVPRDLCAFLDDKEHTHWIPEIFSFGQYMATERRRLNVKSLSIDNVRLCHRTSCEEIPLMSVPTKHEIDSLTPWNNLKLPRQLRRMSMEAEFDNNRKLELKIDRQNVSMWWQDRKEKIRGEAKIELHIEKNKVKPRPHPGFFMSTYESEKSPTWRFMSSSASRWKIKKAKEQTIHNQQPKLEIRDHHERKSEFLDLAESLNPEIGLKSLPRDDDTQDASEYLFSFLGIPFHLLSTAEEFILKEAINDEVDSEDQGHDHNSVHNGLWSMSDDEVDSGVTNESKVSDILVNGSCQEDPSAVHLRLLQAESDEAVGGELRF